MFFGRRSAAMLSGTVAQRLKALEADADFYLVNSDGMKIPAVKEAILARPDIQFVIFDEMTTYRNSRTDVSKAARAISSAVRLEIVLSVSATCASGASAG